MRKQNHSTIKSSGKNSKIIAFETFNRLQSKFRLHSTGRPKRQPFISQTSSVTEAPSDEVEAEQEGDDDVEPARVTQYVMLV